MSSPPPGYNPDASQLHGGTDAPIAKVMGGGGGGPDGYNESQSLLQGGTDAPIVKMTGGGDEEELVTKLQSDLTSEEAKNPKNIDMIKILKGQLAAARAAAARAVAARAAAARAAAKARALADSTKAPVKTGVRFAEGTNPQNGTGSLEQHKRVVTAIQAEVYEPTFSHEDMTEIREFIRSFSLKNPGLMSRYIQLMTSFKKRATDKWKTPPSHLVKSQTPPFPSAAAPELPAHKLVDVLPQTTTNIIIIPPIKGSYEKFLCSVEFLYANEVIKENDIVEDAVLIFMYPLFGKGKDAQRLLYSFLTLQEKNIASVFALQGDDAESKEIGPQFYEGIAESNFIDRVFLNYLNPSYILLPRNVGGYDGILFTSDVGVDPKFPKIKNNNTPVSKLLNERKSAFSFNAKKSESDETFKNYLTIASQNGSTELPAAKADIEICGNLKTVFDMKDMNPFQISDVDDIYVLRLENDRRPLLCKNMMYTDEKFESGELDPAFHTAGTVEVYVDGQKWKFRDPRQSEYTGALDKIAEGPDVPTSRNLVIQNWERAIYSASEAGFLNHINLSPRILSETFDSDVWKKEVAKFLNNLVTSNCFEDTDILSKGQCEDTRIFLSEVFNRLFMMDSVKEGELVVPPLVFSPLPRGQGAGPIAWPTELEYIKTGEYKAPPEFESIESRHHGEDLEIDVIVIHKESVQRKYGRLRINIQKEIAQPTLNPEDLADFKKGPEIVFSEILEDLKEDYPDFLFIY